jgi:hypothetical protein
MLDATMVGIGAMIGAGIFVLTGLAAETAGAAAIVVFALNGGVTTFPALSYADTRVGHPAQRRLRIRSGGVLSARLVRDGLDPVVHLHDRRGALRARVRFELHRVAPPL